MGSRWRVVAAIAVTAVSGNGRMPLGSDSAGIRVCGRVIRLGSVVCRGRSVRRASRGRVPRTRMIRERGRLRPSEVLRVVRRVRWRRWGHLNRVLALIARGSGILGGVACAVLGRPGLCRRARDEELLLRAAGVPCIQWLGAGSGWVKEARVVAAVEAWPACGICRWLLLPRCGNGVLSGRHMAVPARVVAAE